MISRTVIEVQVNYYVVQLSVCFFEKCFNQRRLRCKRNSGQHRLCRFSVWISKFVITEKDARSGYKSWRQFSQIGAYKYSPDARETIGHNDIGLLFVENNLQL